MTNEEKILTLVLQNDKLRNEYGIDYTLYDTVDSAIDSPNPIVSIIGKVIRKKSGYYDITNKDLYKELYSDLLDYLNEI